MPAIPIILKKTGVTLEFEESDCPPSVVDLAFDQGIMLKAGCRNGYCQTCKCKVLSGDFEHFFEVEKLEEDECLPCCCFPKSELTLDL